MAPSRKVQQLQNVVTNVYKPVSQHKPDVRFVIFFNILRLSIALTYNGETCFLKTCLKQDVILSYKQSRILSFTRGSRYVRFNAAFKLLDEHQK